jgi:membrane associated rhomboid family serine protease
MRISLKALILLTICTSLLSVIFPSLMPYIALSWTGIKHLYLWQLGTYVFAEKGPISLGFFLQLTFNMYVLWAFGSSLMERSRPLLFFVLYFGAAITAGLISLLFPHSLLTGSITPIYAILIAWMMINPYSQLLLFFAIPFKAHYLIVALLGFSLFLSLSNGDLAGGATLLVSAFFGYLFSLIVWRNFGPFPFLRPFEKALLRFLEKKKKPYTHSKIYDIKSGTPILSDEQFMDAMLDRISLYGEGHLTPEEKKRMQAISKKKNSSH